MKKNLFNLKITVLILGIFFTITANAFTAVTSGNWSSAATWGGIAPSSTVSNQDIIIPVGISVVLDADVSFSGLLNTFSVDGALSSNSSDGITITQGSLSGDGYISINRITFNTLGTTSFTGTLHLKRLINSTPALSFSAIGDIADTLELQSGNILLNTNANLTMLSNSTVKVNNGSLTVNGGVFSTGNAYNAMYVGTSKTTGIELNSITMQHIYINMNNNSQIVTLNSNMTVNGNITITAGKVALNGKQVILVGELNLTPGSSFISTAATELVIGGTGPLSSSLVFDAGSSIGILTINRTGQVKIESPLSVASHLNLLEGNFNLESGAALTMGAGSIIRVVKGSLTANTGTFIGTASYNVEYMGNTNASSGEELKGSGLNDLTVSYSSGSNLVMLSNNISVGGQLMMTKGKIVLNGRTLILNGTISQNPNAVFTGDAGAEMHLNLTSVTSDSIYFDVSNSSSQTLSKLKINTAGTSAIVLGSPLTIDTELNFMSGKIELSNSDLVIMPAASITGHSDTRYVMTSEGASGSLVMNIVAGSSHVTFPIGTSSNYSPAHIQQTSAASSGNFKIRAMNTVLSNATYGSVSSNTLKVVDRTWFVSSGVSTIDANLKFGWVTAAEVNGFNRANAYVTHYTSSAWDATAAGSATAAANSTYELSRTGMTSLGAFAVTEIGQALKLDEIINAGEFTLYPNPSKDLLNIQLVNPTDTYKYELIDVTGRLILTRSNKSDLNTFDISNLETGCYFIKITDTANNKTLTKRFVKD